MFASAATAPSMLKEGEGPDGFGQGWVFRCSTDTGWLFFEWAEQWSTQGSHHCIPPVASNFPWPPRPMGQRQNGPRYGLGPTRVREGVSASKMESMLSIPVVDSAV